jgi:hypothetical protein
MITMKMYREENLSSFEFWSGAKDNADKLTLQELNQIESELESQYPNGIDENELNDLFRFDFEMVLEWINKKECPNCENLINLREECECQEIEEENEDEEE